MLKKLTLTLLFVTLSFTFVQGKGVEIKTYGVSDRTVAASTTDIFTVKYTGLANTGVGTTVYLAGNVIDTTFTAPNLHLFLNLDLQLQFYLLWLI